MNTETAYAKCPCNVCSAKIEFEPSRAGYLATCPHCGMETTLFIPVPPRPLKPEIPKPEIPNPNLTPCPGCGRSLSVQAEICPQCGHPLREKPSTLESAFKGTFAVVLALILISVIFGILHFALSN